MRNIEQRLTDVRTEIVTAAFVASGRPEGIHDLGRFLEYVNNAALGEQIELHAPAVRPLYRATASLQLDAPLLIRRREMIFANFDGPHFTRGATRPETSDVGVLLMVPPFQIQGVLSVPKGADVTQALRFAAERFFVLNSTRVFDTEGAPLGEGERIVVNGAAVQMMSATRQHISVVAAVPGARRDAQAQSDEQPAVDIPRVRAA